LQIFPNRIVFPAFQTNFATPDGFVTEPLLQMYKKIARGGCGLIIIGCIAVSDCRRSTGVPVMCAGNIRSLELAEKIVSEGRSDLVCIGRSRLADPYFIKKSINGEPVNKCDDCRSCMFFLHGAPSVSCPQNPEL